MPTGLLSAVLNSYFVFFLFVSFVLFLLPLSEFLQILQLIQFASLNFQCLSEVSMIPRTPFVNCIRIGIFSDSNWSAAVVDHLKSTVRQLCFQFQNLKTFLHVFQQQQDYVKLEQIQLVTEKTDHRPSAVRRNRRGGIQNAEEEKQIDIH